MWDLAEGGSEEGDEAEMAANGAASDADAAAEGEVNVKIQLGFDIRQGLHLKMTPHEQGCRVNNLSGHCRRHLSCGSCQRPLNARVSRPEVQRLPECLDCREPPQRTAPRQQQIQTRTRTATRDPKRSARSARLGKRARTGSSATKAAPAAPHSLLTSDDKRIQPAAIHVERSPILQE